MKNLSIEIAEFLGNSNYALNTVRNYKNKLLEFTKYLANLTDTPSEELHLEKIYEVYDINRVFITYKPLDVEILDEYFSSLLSRGYYSMKDSKDALGAFFNYLNRNYEFPNIMNELNYNLNYLRPPNIKVDILSNHDILKFFQYIIFHSPNRDRDVLLFVLFLTLGSRSSEIVNIKLRDINWEDNTIFLPKIKHSKSLTVPLREGLADSIKTFSIKYNLKDNDYLFDLTQTQVRELFYRYLDKAKLPKVTLHSLRHTFATMLADAGAAITEVQQLLGHEDVMTTKGYIHPNITRNKNIYIKENQEIFRDALKLFKF